MDTADAELIRSALALLTRHGHQQAAAVLASARDLAHPTGGSRWTGRWVIWADAATIPAKPFDVAQQIKRALNTAAGAEASSVELRPIPAPTA